MKATAMLLAASLVALAGVSATPTAAADHYTIADCLLRDDGHPPEHCIEDCVEEPNNPLHCEDDH